MIITYYDKVESRLMHSMVRFHYPNNLHQDIYLPDILFYWRPNNINIASLDGLPEHVDDIYECVSRNRTICI